MSRGPARAALQLAALRPDALPKGLDTHRRMAANGISGLDFGFRLWSLGFSTLNPEP